MNDNGLFRREYQSQLDEWRAGVEKLKVRAAMGTPDVQIEMNRHVTDLGRGIDEADARLSELHAAGEDGWGQSVESSWDALKDGLSAAALQFG